MSDETKNTAVSEIVTPPVSPTTQVPPTVGEKTEAQARIDGLIAERARNKAENEALTKKVKDLEAVNMSDTEKAIERATQSATEPYKQREERLKVALDSKLAKLTPEQKALVPAGLSIEDAFIHVDNILGYVGAKTGPAPVGGPVNPQEAKPKTFSMREFREFQEKAGEPGFIRANREKWEQLKQARAEGRLSE